MLWIYDEKNDVVMLVEDYGPKDWFFIEWWRTFHFPKTSPIVQKSYREWWKSIFIIKPWVCELDLVPAFSPIWIESCTVSDDEISLVYAWHWWWWVSASFSRWLAVWVKWVRVIAEGGWKKFWKGEVILPKYNMLLIWIDDTDNEEVWATYALAHTIAQEVSNWEEIKYVIHGNVQLYPKNPHKTKNCFSTVIWIAYIPWNRENIISHFISRLKEETVSDKTVMCVHDGITISEELKNFTEHARNAFIDSLDSVYNLAKEQWIEIYEITWKHWIIWALAAIWAYDRPDYASSLPNV